MSKPSSDALFDESSSRPINGIVLKPGATRAGIYSDKNIVGKFAKKLKDGLRRVDSSLQQQEVKKAVQQEQKPTHTLQLPKQQKQTQILTDGVGDGGLAWKRRSMKRAREQAERENRSLRDVLIDRVGVAEAEQLLLNKDILTDPRGVVISWNSDRGFGFIRPSSLNNNSNNNDLFCHARSIVTSGLKELRKGMIVEYEMRRNTRSGKMEARGVRVVIDTSVNERKKRKRKEISLPDRETKEREASRASFLYGGSSSSSSNSSRKPSSSSSSKSLALKKKPKLSTTTIETLSTLSKNELAARALRARMSGNMEECEKIQEVLRDMQETVIVTPLDEHGRMISELSTTTTSSISNNNSSASSQLRKMLREEKQESNISHDLAWSKTYAQNEKEEDKGRAIQPSSSSLNLKRGTSERDAAMRRAVQAQLKWDTNRARCVYCVGSDAMLRQKRLFIHVSENATLQLCGNPLVPGHCRISPRDHVSSMILADENQWEGVRQIETCLRRMITNAGMGCIMLETVTRGGTDSRYHTYIDFIPVPRRVEQDAPLYFKQALMDSDEQWSQHKKIIDTTKRGLRRCVRISLFLSLSLTHTHINTHRYPKDLHTST